MMQNRSPWGRDGIESLKLVGREDLHETVNRVDQKNTSGHRELRGSCRFLGGWEQGLDEAYRFQENQEVPFGRRPGDRSDSTRREMSEPEVLTGLEPIEKSSYTSQPRP